MAKKRNRATNCRAILNGVIKDLTPLLGELAKFASGRGALVFAPSTEEQRVIWEQIQWLKAIRQFAAEELQNIKLDVAYEAGYWQATRRRRSR